MEYQFKPCALALDEQLSFFADAYLIDKYLLEGWSAQEPNYRWTDGGRARLQLKVPEVNTQNIVLRVECSGFLANDKLDHQFVEVLANDIKVASWKVGHVAWHEAIIPRELIKDDSLIVTFLIGNATSPFEVGISEDKRKLGLCVQNLEISESGLSIATAPAMKPSNHVFSNSLNFDEILSFGSDAHIVDRYLLNGWSAQEQWCRWTDGEQASLQFYLTKVGIRNLLLRATCSAFLANGKLDHQSVDVLVNDVKIATWQVKGIYEEREAFIPIELVKSGKVQITFLISDAMSPFQLQISNDKRQLGLSFQNLKIVEVSNKTAASPEKTGAHSKRSLFGILRS